MDFYNYLLKEYGYDEPIFSEDLLQELTLNPNTLRQSLKRLADADKIKRYKYKAGIYYIPNPNSILKRSALSVNKIIKNKYLVKRNNRIGYVTGLDFANSLNLTTQVPGLIEIVTEVESSNIRYVEYNQRRVALRKSKTNITGNNYKVLQILELITNFQKVSDVSFDNAKPKISDYVKDVSLERKELDRIISLYPKAYRQFIGSGLYNEVARGQRGF